MKTCPFCAEEIQDAAVLCKHCGSRLDQDSSAPPGLPVAEPPAAPTAPTIAPGSERPAVSPLAGQLIAGIGGLLIGIGALLPWATASAPFVGSISTNGLQGGGDGIWTLIAGVLIIVLAIVAGVSGTTGTAWGIGLLGVIAGGVAAADLPRIQDRIRQAKSASSLIVANIGAGIFATFVGAALAIVGAFVLGQRLSRKQGRPSVVPASDPAFRVVLNIGIRHGDLAQARVMLQEVFGNRLTGDDMSDPPVTVARGLTWDEAEAFRAELERRQVKLVSIER